MATTAAAAASSVVSVATATAEAPTTSTSSEPGSLIAATTGLVEPSDNDAPRPSSPPAAELVREEPAITPTHHNGDVHNLAESSNPERSLLREWHYPPVAPAVVVVEGTHVGDSTSAEPTVQATAASASTTTNSPSVVATFVRDLVRTSMDHILYPPSGSRDAQDNHNDNNEAPPPRGNHNINTALHVEPRQTQLPQSSPEDNVAVLSIRSEADAQAFHPVASGAVHAANGALHPTTTVSARTVADVMNEEVQYILVDGDLIAISPPPPQQHGHAQDGSTANRRRNSTDETTEDPSALYGSPHFFQPHKPIRPGRMRRGVRKIGKWFARNKKKHHRATSHESAAGDVPATTPAAALTGLEVQTGSAAAASTAMAMRMPDGLEASTMSLNSASHPTHASHMLARQSSLGDGSTHSAGGAGTHAAAPQSHHHGRGKGGRRERGSRRMRQDAAREVAEQVQARAGLSHPSGESPAVAAALPPTQHPHAAAAVAGWNHPPPREPLGETTPTITASSGATKSVTATPLGTEDQVQQGHVATAVVVEYDQIYDDHHNQNDLDIKLRKGDIPASMVPVEADFKVDKGEAPDVQAMLVRAEHETNTDLELGSELEASSSYAQRSQKGKSDGSSVPLSQAQRSDKHVHNDMLKVLLVGSVGPAKSALARAIRESQKKPRTRTTLGLDVHTWSASDVNFQIWDVQGASNASCQDTVLPNFGAHPGTQSLFFSHESLYLLVWDLACHNTHVHPVFDYDSDEEGDEQHNDFVREQVLAEADRALHQDIASRVLSWVDRIAQRAPRSAILPVAIIPDGMEEKEVHRRCSKLYEMLENYVKWKEAAADFDANQQSMPNIVLDDSRNVLSVNFSQHYGIQQIQETMVAIATDTSRSVFEHVGTPVPPGTVEILEYTKSVKHQHKLIRLDHVLGAVGDVVPVDQAIPALHFLSSVGELLYFGSGRQDDDNVLSSFIVLSRQWLVSALSCILRNDLKRELSDARKFMNMQCIYSEQQFEENEIIKTLGAGAATSCPLLSDQDAAMLWRSMSFMREAADRYSQMNENSTCGPTVFYFLERLLVQFGIFIPFGSLPCHSGGGGLEASASSSSNNVFFVPSLLSQTDPGDIWRYRAPESWTTTLCNSWLFRDGAPSDLFEYVAVALLRDLYIFTREFSSAPKEQLARTRSTPLGRASRHDFVEEHSRQSVGPARIHQIICWKSAMLLKIGTVFPDRESDEFRESFVEIFVTIVDQNSTHCVASDAMRVNMQRVIVSGKGQAGLAGLKLFKGGYQAVLDSVQASLATFNNVNMQIVCPECLARGNPRRASTWGWDEVVAAGEERREASIVCRRGHRVKIHDLIGSSNEEPLPIHDPHVYPSPIKSVPEILPSVVLVGLWDPKLQQIRSVGSGFVADKKFGLIVTAGHVLFNMEEGPHYGTVYMGVEDAKVVVGVNVGKDSKNAVWRYFAEVIADDVKNNVDACVLKITTRMEQDVDEEEPGCNVPEVILDASKMKEENLIKLKVETNFELGEPVRLLGYSQRERVSDPDARRQILRSPDFAKGYICRVFSNTMSDDSSSSSDSASKNTFSPREEIVTRCPTIVGHSGGPCVNDDGLVVGILSRADPADPHLCYLVPAGQLKVLVRKARVVCTRPVYTTLNNDFTTSAVHDPEAGRYHTM